MGQRESVSHARRVDPRWARVTLEQLRDEEFLSKHLRRQETIAGARDAARASGAARRQSANVGLFMDETRDKRDRNRALWKRLLKPRGEPPLEEENDSGGSHVPTMEQRARMEEARQDQLMTALVLLADLPHPTRTAYLLCHLEDLLARYCVVPDPVIELVMLRKGILRDVYDAVSAQHQGVMKNVSLVQSLASTLKDSSSSSHEVGGWKGEPSITTKTRGEVSTASEVVVELIDTLLVDDGIMSKRELLREVVTLIDELPLLSLAPSRPGVDSKARSAGRPMAATVRKVVRRLQNFLFSVALAKRFDNSGVAEAFDVSERTMAVTCLFRLAAAAGSVRDLLLVISLLLGAKEAAETVEVGAHSEKDKRLLVASSRSPSPKSLKSSRQVVPSHGLTSARAKEPIQLKECEGEEVLEDERVDLDNATANLAVEQRLKQVHKQRMDVIAKSDIDGQPTAIDQLLASNSKRKTSTKASALVHTKAAIVNAGVLHTTPTAGPGPTVLHRASILHGISVHPMYSLTAKNSSKDDFNNSSLQSNGVFSFDPKTARSDGSRSPSPRKPSSPTKAVKSPEFLPLLVGPTLLAIDQTKPTAPLRPSQRTGMDTVQHNATAPDEDHEVWSCGQNSYGELGHGDTNTRKSFERIEALQQKEVVLISAGNEHTIALGADGTVWTCGYNDNGQCGHGVTTRINHLTEIQKLGEAPITQVHAYNGCEHTIIVAQDGRVASCGYNYRGQLGHGNTQSETVPKIIRGLEAKHVRLVSCSYYHTVIACDGGSTGGHSQVYTFGRNDYGQLGHGDVIDRKVPHLVESVGDQSVGSIACGQYHTMVVTSTGKLLAFGKNDYGQLGVETTENQLSPVHVKTNLERATCLEVRCGYYHSIVLTAGAHVFGFGRNDYGQLGLGKLTNSAAANLQLQQQRYAVPQLIEDLEGKEIVRLACGCYHTIAASDNGILYVFGRNNHGQLGTGDVNERQYPYPIDDFVGKRIAMVAAGFYHTLVLTGGKEVDESDDKPERSGEVHIHGSAGRWWDESEAEAAASILASATARDIFHQSNSTNATDTTRQRHTDAQNDSSLPTDPSRQCDDEDSRMEDPTSVDGILENSGDESSTWKSTHGAIVSGNSVRPKGNSVEIAMILLAELDRLSKPFQPKRSAVVHSVHSLSVADSATLLDDPTAEVDLTSFDGCFEPYAVHVTCETFQSVSRLIGQLSTRPFSALADSSFGLTTQPQSRVTRDKNSPQFYALSVCFKLLNANLVQLLRSGAHDLVVAHRMSMQQLTSHAGLSDFASALDQVRTVLLQILGGSKNSDDVSVDPTHCPDRLVGEALSSLLLGFEIFFPCQCSQLSLLSRIIGSQVEDGMESKCPCCRGQIDLSMIRANASHTQQFTVPAVLSRLAEDVIVAKFLPTDQSGNNESMKLLVRLVKAVLERENLEFMHRLGQLSGLSDDDETDSGPVKPSPTATASYALLSSVQKHLAAWADSLPVWEWHSSTHLSNEMPIVHRIRELSRRTFRLDDEAAAQFPMRWRGMIEFALLVCSHSCDVLLQLLSRCQPSPTAARYRPSPFESSHFTYKLAHTLDKSIVSQLVPSLVACLLTFSHTPAFAVSLLPSLSTLLKLLDDWNSSSEVLQREADSIGMDRLGRKVAPTVSSKHKLAPTTIRRGLSGALSSRSMAKDAQGQPVPVADALALTWSLLLEKEVAMLCGAMAATIASGDAVISVGIGSPPSTNSWASSSLFRGGIDARIVRKGAMASDAPYDFTVPHSPFVGGRTSSFLLVIPWAEIEDDDSHDGGEVVFPTVLRARRFLSAMANAGVYPSVEGMVETAPEFCEWVRQRYSVTDNSYRMLLRQAQVQREQSRVESALEDAFFAALLHHSCLGLFALLVATTRATTDRSSPPRSLLKLWRVVADFRKRLVAKRTAIKNSEKVGESSEAALASLRSAILDRCHLLQLVAVEDEEEHRLRVLDGGFVAPHDPAHVFRAYINVAVDAKSSIRHHAAARYGDGNLPFLIAFPTSRWRCVRTLFHVISRWKSQVSSAQNGPPPVALEALEFVTDTSAKVADLHQFVQDTLIDPCRRLSLSTRGYELLCDLVRLPKLECVRVALLHEVSTSLRARARPVLFGNIEFLELCRTAQNDFVVSVMELLVNKAGDELTTAGQSSKEWVLLLLIRCLSIVHFTPEQFAFLNDSGIVNVLLKLLHPDTSVDTPDACNDSIRAIAVGKEGRMVDPQLSTFSAAVWSLLRYVVAHVASSSSKVPLFPSTPDLFNALASCGDDFRVAEEAPSKLTSRLAFGAMGTSSSATIRRSFEIIEAPRRFSPLSKGLVFAYAEMLQPSSGNLSVMSPLVKPTEFSITTWLYVSATASTKAKPPSSPSSDFNSQPTDEDKRVVFVRGDHRDLSPYLLLCRDMLDHKWHLEVGVATQHNGRLAWERLVSKDAISDGKWVHVTMVMEGSKLRLYVNGILDSQRSLSAPLVLAVGATIDYDFAFGRQQRQAVTGIDPPEMACGALAMEFLAALLHASVTSSIQRLMRSFDGLLSHFRFHNRALSPIHVRIVFDEKKPVKEDDHHEIGGSTTSKFEMPAQRLLELHALFRVLVESDEGRAQLRDVSWTRQLWELFMTSECEELQASSLRLLQLILPFQRPDDVASALALESRDGSALTLHILKIVAVCLLPTAPRLSDRRLPVTLRNPRDSDSSATANRAPVELKNSTAARLVQESERSTKSLILAGELASFVVDLHGSSPIWQAAVVQAIVSAIGQAPVSPSLELVGCLYLLSDRAETLSSGRAVEIMGSKERATVIAVDDGNQTTTKKGKNAEAVFIAVDSQTEVTHRQALPWHDQVYGQCEAYRQDLRVRKGDARLPEPAGHVPSSSLFVRIHRDDLTGASASDSLLRVVQNDADTKMIETLLAHSEMVTAPTQDDDAYSTLSRWQTRSLLVKVMAKLVETSRGAAAALGNDKLIQQLMTAAVEDDGSSRFWTLRDIERRVWIVRARILQVLRDLGDAAEPEVAQWLSAKIKQEKSTSKKAPETARQVEEVAHDEEADDVVSDQAPEPAAGSPLSLRLELAMDDLDPQVDATTRRTNDSGVGGDSPDGRDGFPSASADDEDGGGGGGDDSEGDVDEEEEAEDEESEDDDEDAETEEYRQEFVEELMVMGFPEEWCVLALKQTESDIVSASAWIVDNLEYLSRLQTTLDKQRDAHGADKSGLAQDEDDEDGGDVGERPGRASPVGDEGVVSTQGSPVRADGSPLTSDKETGRRLFGEMYFPFQEGGFASNARDQFFTNWQADSKPVNDSSATRGTPPGLEGGDDSQPGPQNPDQKTATTGESIDHFTQRVESLEIDGLLDEFHALEHACFVVSSRQVLITTLRTSLRAGTQCDSLVKNGELFQLLKMVFFRGRQFTFEGASSDDAAAVGELVSALVIQYPGLAQSLLDTAVCELESAASSSTYEATLWTQRELQRSDALVLQEPAVELAASLAHVSICIVPCPTLFPSVDSATKALSRLRAILRSSNLAIKFISITTTTRVLTQLGSAAFPVDALLHKCRLDLESFLHAAKHRLHREQVQHRALFSLYLQAYVEILHELRRVQPLPLPDDFLLDRLPPPITTTCFATPSTCSPEASCPRLVFDRTKCRSKLVQISDDGLTVTYSGNEMWKAVVATQGFATGVHEWQLRIDKSSSAYLFLGVATHRANMDSFLGADDQSWGFIGDKALYYQRNRLRVYGDTFSEGDCVGVHLDCERGTLSFSKNGVSLGVAFENIMDEVYPAVAFYSRHQQVSIVPMASSSEKVASPHHDAGRSEGTVEEAVTVCEMMEAMVAKRPLRRELVSAAFSMTQQWLAGRGRHIVTRTGVALWVDGTRSACSKFGFRPDDRVRTPRGNGRVLGVADGRLWIEVDNEAGAWHMDPSRLRSLTLSLEPLRDQDGIEDPADDAESSIRLSESDFAAYVQDSAWSLAVDRLVLSLINGACEVSNASPWNVTPAEVIKIVRSKAQEVEAVAGVQLHLADDESDSHRKLVARVGFLRFFNAYFRRVVGFFDMTWQYFNPQHGLTPTRLLSKCRGSIFTCIKNEFFAALMDKTVVSVQKADDDYDYPEDLTVMTINRPKAATAKCHPGTTKSVLLSMFGQAFEELHFLPLRTLRMVYSHPMDDGQLRSFKVKFEGEGVDDYGGPYREFFSQFFAELQMICSPEGETSDSTQTDSTAAGISFLPFWIPSPNWRNGVGSNREKYIVNGSLSGATHVGKARVVLDDKFTSAVSAAPQRPMVRPSFAENPEIKRQLYREMSHFLGQMIGMCLPTRVCVRLDLATSVWKQLVGEEEDVADAMDDEAKDKALASLKEIDYVAFSLLKTLRGLSIEYVRSCGDRGRQAEIEEELAAMDLTFTTYLSDGRLVELCENGSNTVVTMKTLQQYVAAALRARVNESREVVNMIKQGIHRIMPVAALSMLTWEELEKRVCGVAEVDVELLKQNTEYDEDLSAKDESIQRFWRVLSAMAEDDKVAFLRFVWARSRLPVGTAQFTQKFKIQSLAATSNSSDGSINSSHAHADSTLPKSHTCFFALQLPRYSSDEVCRKQLLYAIHNCVEMDGDFRLADSEMTGWTDVNPNDQLRF